MMATPPFLKNFVWGKKGQMMTPEQVTRERELADAMASRPVPGAGHWMAAVNQGLQGFIGGRDNRAADRAESEGMARGRSVIDALLAGGAGQSPGGGYSRGASYAQSGTWTPAAATPDALYPIGVDALPAPNEQVAGLDMGLDTPSMTPQEMIIAGAEARGLDPLDVATAISYETGGRFDPMISGPTTQWGTHRGLIQFGEPQAKQYGADFSTPDAAMQSQLNPDNGAVWNYLDQTGVKPGMGLDNIYSAINAGAPGRFNASDANNGGAAGTVAQKVAGMGDHRAKAAEFLGGTWTPSEGGSNPVTIATSGGAPAGGTAQNDIMSALIAASSDPWAMKQAGPVIQALLGQQIGRQDADYTRQQNQADPMYQMSVEKQRLELDALRNPGAPKPIEINGQLIDPTTGEVMGDYRTPEPGYTMVSPDEVAALGLPPGAYQRGADQEIKKIGGGGQTINFGGSEIGTIPPGFEVFTDPKTGARSMRPIPGGPAASDQAKIDAAAANRGGNAAISSDVVTAAARAARDADKERVLTGFAGKVAAYDPGTENAEVYRQVDVLKANASVENINAMRAASPTGAALGAASDKDIALLASKSGALDPASKYFQRDLDDYERTLLRIIHGDKEGDKIYHQTRGDDPPTDGVLPAPMDFSKMSDAELKAFIDGNGQ